MKTVITCNICKTQFTKLTPNNMYCSLKCSSKAKKNAQKRRDIIRRLKRDQFVSQEELDFYNNTKFTFSRAKTKINIQALHELNLARQSAGMKKLSWEQALENGAIL